MSVFVHFTAEVDLIYIFPLILRILYIYLGPGNISEKVVQRRQFIAVGWGRVLWKQYDFCTHDLTAAVVTRIIFC